MKTGLLVILLNILFPFYASRAEILFGTATSQRMLQNNMFTDSLLSTGRSKSVLQCATLCLHRKPRCWTFTFTKTSLTEAYGDCRLHSKMVNATSAFEIRTRTRVYKIDWLERPCDLNIDCPVPSSECFDSKCLCSPGYYYSVNTDTCTNNCSDAELGAGFLIYHGSHVAGVSTLPTHWNARTVQECLDQCVAIPNDNCKSTDVQIVSGGTFNCWPQNYTALAPEGTFMNKSDTIHCQRMCL